MKNDIADLQARLVGWAIRLDIRNDYSEVACQAQARRHHRRDGLRVDANPSLMNVALLTNLIVDVLDHVGGNRKSQPFAAARLSKDEGVNTDHPAIGVNQRTAAVSGIDGSVSLDVDHAGIRPDLARGGTHHTHADGAFQTQRIAEG